MARGSLALVGVGNMGEALLRGLLDRGVFAASQVAAAEKSGERAATVAQKYGIRVAATIREACEAAETVILSVKPQDAEAAAVELGRVGSVKLVVSVCAGVSLARLSALLPDRTPVVRVMPNAPALVGRGVSVYCANPYVDERAVEAVETLLRAVGAVHRVETESLMDAVTGLSGSGPAYAYVFLEALADGGVLMGLPRDLARALAAQTLLGAATVAESEGSHTAELKDRVASPGGTTIAGLRELERGGFRAAVMEAVRAATVRSRELGG